jgi:hypothetical protein
MEQLMENEFRLVDESFTDEMWQQLETKNDFDVVNASDRLLGTQGCESPR